MKVNLVGIHKVRKKLASGRVETYYYAWRGGPRIMADPDTYDFTAEFVRLSRDREEAPYKGCVAEIIREYLKSPEYTKLKPSTREGYDFAIKNIETNFYDMSAAKVSSPGTRKIFMQWRDEIAETHPRKADLFMSVLKRIMWFGMDREMIERNPLEKVGKVSDETRRDVIWTDEEIERFKASASEPMVRALMLGLCTGQRQGDLLALTWRAYDGQSIALRQSKTGAHVRVKASQALKDYLDNVPRGSAVTMLVNNQGKPWASGFKSSWRKAMAKAGIVGRTFHDLRGTFVTLAYRNGASIKEIAEVTGHSEKDAETIIRKHYLVSSAAIDRIEERTQIVNRPK